VKPEFDVIVIGAGAAGMMCAAVAGQRGARVALIDHAERIGEKIRISGGGRCNFTNVGAGVHAMVGQNPRFARFALNDYKAADFIDLIKSHHIGFHEKHKGQLFCDDSAQNIIDMLRAECAKGSVKWFNPVSVDSIQKTEASEALFPFSLQTTAGTFTCKSLVIASGGLSIPKIGATDFGYKIAKQFGLKLIETRPALVPLTFDAAEWQHFVPLAGVALPVRITSADGGKFDEDLLFTHRGISGPAVLQISNYWNPGKPLSLDFSFGQDFASEWIAQKNQSGRTLLNTIVQGTDGQRFAKQLVQQWLVVQGMADLQDKRLTEVPDKSLRKLHESLRNWQLTPDGTEGYKKAEVTRGGVDTNELDQRSLQAKRVPGLHFIGEVVDITGWLGGYNFQWAWSSGVACAKAMTSNLQG
jgi:predicted Rossmann fold flavoprotein